MGRMLEAIKQIEAQRTKLVKQRSAASPATDLQLRLGELDENLRAAQRSAEDYPALLLDQRAAEEIGVLDVGHDAHAPPWPRPLSSGCSVARPARRSSPSVYSRKSANSPAPPCRRETCRPL